MSANCEDTVAKNLLRPNITGDLNQCIDDKRFVPIRCHFGEGDWSIMLQETLNTSLPLSQSNLPLKRKVIL